MLSPDNGLEGMALGKTLHRYRKFANTISINYFDSDPDFDFDIE